MPRRRLLLWLALVAAAAGALYVLAAHVIEVA